LDPRNEYYEVHSEGKGEYLEGKGVERNEDDEVLKVRYHKKFQPRNLITNPDW